MPGLDPTSKRRNIFINPSAKAFHEPSLGQGDTFGAFNGKLIDWDLTSAYVAQGQSYPQLKGVHGNAFVQDKLRQMLDLLIQALDQALVIAEGGYDVIVGGKQVRTASPMGGVPAYAELTKLLEGITKHIKDPATVDESSRRLEANKYTLPPSVFIRSINFIEQCMRFSCAFDQKTYQLLGQYNQELVEHARGMNNFFDTCPNKLSASELYAKLKVVKETLFEIARKCASDGYKRAEAAAKAKSKKESLPTELLSVLKEALGSKEGASRLSKSGESGRAMKGFQHNPNSAQEGAAARERTKSKDSTINASKLESLPKDKSLRVAVIRQALCKWHWLPGRSCSRGAGCKFAHLSPAETAALGIEEEEVKMAIDNK